MLEAGADVRPLQVFARAFQFTDHGAVPADPSASPTSLCQQVRLVSGSFQGVSVLDHGRRVRPGSGSITAPVGTPRLAYALVRSRDPISNHQLIKPQVSRSLRFCGRRIGCVTVKIGTESIATYRPGNERLTRYVWATVCERSVVLQNSVHADGHFRIWSTNPSREYLWLLVDVFSLFVGVLDVVKQENVVLPRAPFRAQV
jgi:hypothetical protein